MSDALIICCPVCAGRNRVPLAKLGGGTCGKCGAALFMGSPVVLNAANFDTHAARSDIPLVVEGGDKPGQWNASDLLSVAV